MMSLSAEIWGECREALLACTESTLEDAFNTSVLYIYKNIYLNSKNNKDKISTIMNMFLNKSDGRHFLIFMEIQRDWAEKLGGPHSQLRYCCESVEYEYVSSKVKQHLSAGHRSTQHLVDNDIENMVKLVRYFLKIPSRISDRDEREKKLATILGLETAPNGDTREHADAITRIIHRICSAFINPGGVEQVEQLAYTLYEDEHKSHHFASETAAWLDLDTFLLTLSKKAVTHTRLQQLQRILESIQPPPDARVLQQAYDASILMDVNTAEYIEPEQALPSSMLNRMLNALNDAREQNDAFPLLRFVMCIINYVEKQKIPEVGDRLTAWYNERTKALGWKEEKKNMVRASVRAYTPVQAPYLLVAVRSENESSPISIRGKGKVMLQAWLTDSQGKIVGPTAAYHSDPVLLRDVPEQLDMMRQRFASYLSNDLVIEIFLPTELLSHAVDHWKIDVGLPPKVKLGIEHKLVVRSLERANNVLIKHKFEAKWGKLLSAAQDRDPLAVEDLVKIYTEKECSAEAFYAKLRDSKVVCVGLQFVPRTAAFRAILKAGIPISLWPRHWIHSPDTPFLTLLEDLLLHEDKTASPEKLNNLPHSVWEQRRGPKSSRSHPIYHLTLLWDNPHRLLPVTPLKYT